MKTDYTSVTEIAGSKVSNEQLLRMAHRYHFAAGFCAGKDVLEVACGAGVGLGYLAKFAKRVVGGDIDQKSPEIRTEAISRKEQYQTPVV